MRRSFRIRYRTRHGRTPYRCACRSALRSAACYRRAHGFAPSRWHRGSACHQALRELIGAHLTSARRFDQLARIALQPVAGDGSRARLLCRQPLKLSAFPGGGLGGAFGQSKSRMVSGECGWKEHFSPTRHSPLTVRPFPYKVSVCPSIAISCPEIRAPASDVRNRIMLAISVG